MPTRREPSKTKSLPSPPDMRRNTWVSSSSGGAIVMSSNRHAMSLTGIPARRARRHGPTACERRQADDVAVVGDQREGGAAMPQHVRVEQFVDRDRRRCGDRIGTHHVLDAKPGELRLDFSVCFLGSCGAE